jgi:hypothetical protein
MQIHGTTINSAAPMPAGNTDRLRHRLEELSASGFIPTKARQNLQQLLMRIDLSASSPVPIELCRELWVSVGNQLDALRQQSILPPHVDRELVQIVSTFCATEIANYQSLMISHCLICGEEHKLQKKNLTLTKPDAWCYLSPADIANRCEGNENFLSIDMKRFFLRGILPLRYQENALNVEMWVEVDKDEFGRFIDRFLSGLKDQSPSNQPLRLKGTLANRLLHNLNDFCESVDVVCDGDRPPTFWVTDQRKALYKAQGEGLSPDLFLQLFSSFAHSQAILERKTRMADDGIPLNRISLHKVQ